jgi:hypothetical protein
LRVGAADLGPAHQGYWKGFAIEGPGLLSILSGAANE